MLNYSKKKNKIKPVARGPRPEKVLGSLKSLETIIGIGKFFIWEKLLALDITNSLCCQRHYRGSISLLHLINELHTARITDLDSRLSLLFSFIHVSSI